MKDKNWAAVLFKFDTAEMLVTMIHPSKEATEKYVGEKYQGWLAFVLNLDRLEKYMLTELPLFLADHGIVGSELIELHTQVKDALVGGIERLEKMEEGESDADAT